MNITIHQGRTPVLPRSDVNIVIDVIRAFTVAHYAFLRGAKALILTATTDEAFLLQKKNPGYLLAGEINGLPIQGFDFDNSPAKMATANVSGRTIVQKTTNGVKAALHALDADAVFVTGFSNARKTAECVGKLWSADATINLIASHPDGDDDLACAEYIKDILLGKEELSIKDVAERIRSCGPAEKFFDEGRPEFNAEDIEFCTKVIAGDFVMYVDSSGKFPMIVRVNEDELYRIGPARERRKAEV
ncbi:2-phosphosulfolactate phosphatase [Neobacillus notoginsengisoli]|uniref:Probable 2-phosphosulfolactate phosphatase n=1 Tax=Neobacillus notoginsengisoli TaxID=1578198 RepID=A0A417YSL2_9BACI|nr:2-phosphosulfolactate phosphatase [Neobacillus notoginsengisoli]RHW38960.1 2-phosphosulfolactate phosphatase [Neobacillus notoginsengisoli]